jgi:hypothetical protein
VIFSPETLQKILESTPILSMAQAPGSRRPFLTRITEQIFFSAAVSIGVIYIDQRDEQKDLAALTKEVNELRKSIDKINSDFYVPRVGDVPDTRFRRR